MIYFRLSERNCIEIVQKLIQLKLVEVTYTCDGKQYLTPHEIVKEIEEELLVHGGKKIVVMEQRDFYGYYILALDNITGLISIATRQNLT